MKAIVKVGNRARGMYAAEIDDSGEFVIFELLDSSEPEAGDVIVHLMSSEAREFYDLESLWDPDL